MNTPLFESGQIVATPGALEALENSRQDPVEFLDRHFQGDWGDMCEEDKEANDLAVYDDSRIFSAYILMNGEKIWIITEWDRSATNILKPEEY